MRTPRSHHLDRFAKQIVKDSKRLPRDGLLTVAEASKLLRVSPAFLNARRGTPDGPKFLRLGSRIFYRPRDLRIWLRSRVRSSTKDRRPASKVGG